MPTSNQYPATRNAQLTPEAFRELAESAIEELYDNADSFELHDLRSWARKLRAALGAQVDYQAHDGGDLDGMLVLREGDQ